MPVACRFAPLAELWVSRLAMQVVSLALRLGPLVRLSVQHPVMQAGLLVLCLVQPGRRCRWLALCCGWRNRPSRHCAAVGLELLAVPLAIGLALLAA